MTRVTFLILYIIIAFLLMFSKHRKKAIVFTLAILFYMTMKMIPFKLNRNAIPVTKEELKTKIEPGDLLFTFNVKERDMYSVYNLAHILSNDDEIHTLYCVEYKSKPYILNTYTDDIFNKRKTYFKDPSSLILLEDKNGVSGRLEPLDEFVTAESATNSFVRVIKTKKKACVFDENNNIKELASKKFVHCAMVVGKYLEYQGLIKNKSIYNDYLYYTPDVLRRDLGVKSNTLFRVVKE